MDPVFHAQNDRYIAFYDDPDEEEDDDGDNPSGRYIARSKHPVSAMFLGAVASTGEVSPPIWFPSGFRLAADAYIKVLRSKIVPWMKRVVKAHGGVPFTFQQDSAPPTGLKNARFPDRGRDPFLDPGGVASKLA